MKLELRHLAPYLPYGLKCYSKEKLPFSEFFESKKEAQVYEMGVISMMGVLKGNGTPLLRPLSDLTKEIEHNGETFEPDTWFNGQSETMHFEEDFLRGITRRETSYNITQCSYNVLNKLFEWHFDVFGLIEQGLAIDKNSQP